MWRRHFICFRMSTNLVGFEFRLLTSLLTSSRWYAHYTWALRRVCKTGAGSLRWRIKSPPCCHSIGSIWFLNLLIVSEQTVVVGSRFHWSTTLCEKSPTIIIFLYLSHATFIHVGFPLQYHKHLDCDSILRWLVHSHMSCTYTKQTRTQLTR